MSKTKELRRIITGQLQATPGGTYHRTAPKDAPFPYKVFSLSSVSFTDARDDFILDVDIWDHSLDHKDAEEIADQVEALFSDANLPAPPIYPTFFRDARFLLDDPDKTMQHIQLRFIVQFYKED